MKIEGNRFLVTGVAGFIGSHLGEALIERGAEVIGVDCLTDYYSPDIKEANLRFLRDSDRFEFHRRNLLEPEFKDVLSRVDGVFHQAAQAGVRSSWGREFDEYIEQNIRSTQWLLQCIREGETVPVVLASSSSVYGIPESLPMMESMRPRPYSPYGVTKLAAENLGLLYCHNFQIPVVALRYFTVFGPRQRPDMAFTRFLTWFHREQPITLFGDGTQSRDFTYVADVVNANILCMERETYGSVYNVGGGEHADLNRVLVLMQEVTQQEVPLDQQAVQDGDVPHTSADIRSIREDAGWEPKVGLEEGLTEQWKWIRQAGYVRNRIP